MNTAAHYIIWTINVEKKTVGHTGRAPVSKQFYKKKSIKKNKKNKATETWIRPSACWTMATVNGHGQEEEKQFPPATVPIAGPVCWCSSVSAFSPPVRPRRQIRHPLLPRQISFQLLFLLLLQAGYNIRLDEIALVGVYLDRDGKKSGLCIFTRSIQTVASRPEWSPLAFGLMTHLLNWKLMNC